MEPKKNIQNQILRLIPLVLFAIAVYYLWDQNENLLTKMLGKSTANIEAHPIGKQAFDFSLDKKNVYTQQNFQLSKLKGFPVLLHFWATWCGPCYTELPELLALSQKLRPLGYTFVAIALDKDWNTVNSYFERNPQFKPMKDSMVLLLDPNNTLARLYGVGGVPETFLINPAFLVDNKFVGPQSWLDNSMKPYLDALKKP